MHPILLLVPLLVPSCKLASVRQDAAKDDAWDIQASHAPSETVSFSTDEGTWLSLDVHPDGQQIVFSMLGDLYTLPIGGGTAKRLLGGTAYDVQPRYSPDGTRIAFASDRSGCENLWTCDLDGGDLRQISEEKRKTVSSPAWSPDGDYLLGRKRLTDTSSLGTVEFWMYHVAGGKGVQVTKKDEQPDAADPWFSPDGRFLYYSARDARYRYDRDPYEGIWQIKRFDRRTGQAVPVTGEMGGCAAPALSPDGSQMAYVRRVDAETVLEVMDMATGRTRRVATGIQRDNQQGFAFHGVFPGYDWTPDGRSLVLTTGGKLWRYDATSGSRTAIPFTAQVEQRVDKAFRVPRPAVQDEVRARVLRWPVMQEGRIVFSALGHLYGAEWGGDEVHRLTDGTDFEFAPAYSPRGDAMAYVTWNDDTGGHVWVWEFAKGPSGRRRVTQHAGQYMNPSFSPDGQRLVFVKGSGAAFRQPNLGSELWHEIHTLDLATGAQQYVIGTGNRSLNRRVTRPHFSPSGKRIFYIENGKAEKPQTVPPTELVSVALDGTDKHTHLKWSKAEEAIISPDGRWVAYSEQHNAYLTALPRMGNEPVQVDAKDSALPVVKLTDEGGEWVNWADGGKTLTYIYGPDFRKIAVADAIAHLQSTEKEKGLPQSDTFEIELSVTRAQPSGAVLYRGARIVTMNGDEVIEDGAIVVENDRITAVGPTSNVSVPSGAEVRDLGGRTIIPGLIDEHAHLHYSSLDVLPQRPWKYHANLAYGITTTHDPSASTHEVFASGEMVEAGIIHGPRIFSTGYILYGAEDANNAVVESLDDARKHVRRLKSLGAISVKSYMQPSREQRQWMMKAAREEGMLVMPEGGGDLEMDITMILDGHTTLEHSLPVAPLYKDVVQLFGQSGTAYTPTLLVAYGGFAGDNWFFQHQEVWQDERLKRFVPAAALEPRARIRNIQVPDEDWFHIEVAKGCTDVMRAGGRVCLGGHGQLQGLGPHWELEVFVQGGMTPLEALRVGTLFPAEALGLDGDLGSIETGKLADFVVLTANPLEDIRNSTAIEFVVKNGQAYTLEELELR